MAVINRADLEASPLADLHAIAGQLGLDGFRRLRRADLIEMIIERQGAGERSEDVLRGGGQASAALVGARGRIAREDRDREAPQQAPQSDGEQREAGQARPGARAAGEQAQVAEREQGGEIEEARRRGLTAAGERTREPDRGGGGRSVEPREARPSAREPSRAAAELKETVAEGAVELQGNGSAFLRVRPGEVSDGDVYVSAAQVRRCELIDGDMVAGPVRLPRRSERYPSLIRVDRVNGVPADEAVRGARFEELRAAFPTERFELGSEDLTLKAIEWLTPIGRGSRATIVGGAGAGKSETLRRVLQSLARDSSLEVMLALVGVRPEEIEMWSSEPAQPEVSLSFAAGADVLSQAVERVVDLAKRRVSRGADVVLALDCLSAVSSQAARKALAAARNIPDGGSLTVLATAEQPFGGETTVIALDRLRTMTGRLPALDLV
jgi:transcription termination factor Rho